MAYRLLDAFQSLFDGKLYKHRASNQGDWVAVHLYEDMLSLGRSKKLAERVGEGSVVVNTQNRRVGVKARRGDGTLGEALPSEPTSTEDGFTVLRGAIATIEIGTEVKILAKAMIKQIDRVINDLQNQAAQFRRAGGKPVCVAVVGINFSDHYTSVEGSREWPTDGKKHKHPIQEAQKAEDRIVAEVSDSFDELILLQFRATNVKPFPFEWVNEKSTLRNYEASLIRIVHEYNTRF